MNHRIDDETHFFTPEEVQENFPGFGPALESVARQLQKRQKQKDRIPQHIFKIEPKTPAENQFGPHKLQITRLTPVPF